MPYEIGAIRTEPSEDGTHAHIQLAGYLSPHTPGEPIMIPPERIIQKAALGESFVVTVDGEQVEVKAGTCAVCGHEPYLVTDRDEGERNRLFDLPRK